MAAVPSVRKSETFRPIGPVNRPGGYIGSGSYEALLVSEPHFRLPSGAWSGGGPFYAYKKTLSHEGYRRFPGLRNSVDFTTNIGSVSNGPTSLGQPVPLAWSTERDATSGYYATGYKRARPGNPVAGLGQFLVELRSLPTLPFSGAFKKGKLPLRVPIQHVPGMLKGRLAQFRNLGSEYLNVQFGWLPFVKDVQQMYNLWHTIDKRMAQIVRENGKYIRRKATVKNETTSDQSTQEFGLAYVNVRGAPPNYFGGDQRTVYNVRSKTTERVWFSGSFRYYIPDVGSSLWDKRARAALFGVLPTPELLWNVLPWSWLVDWFSNVGDVVSNVGPNAVDNLTTRYSFIMRRVTSTTEWHAEVHHGSASYTGDPLFKNSWPAGGGGYSTVSTVDVKTRVGGGNPFGLNVPLASLSGYQLSILAALGISRGKVK
jgi:hypothetical protein